MFVNFRIRSSLFLRIKLLGLSRKTPRTFYYVRYFVHVRQISVVNWLIGWSMSLLMSDAGFMIELKIGHPCICSVPVTSLVMSCIILTSIWLGIGEREEQRHFLPVILSELV